MAVRATDEMVEGIITADSGVTLTPFIAAANSLVTELCVAAEFSDARLTLIETWLAAHFYAIRDPRYVTENFGDGVAHNKANKLGMNLSQTTYGQQAMILDTSGALASLSESTEEGRARTIGVTWLGTDPDDA